MPTYWDESREEAIANTLVAEEEVEAAFERFEGRFSLRERLDAMTPMGGDGYFSPRERKRKSWASSRSQLPGTSSITSNLR